MVEQLRTTRLFIGRDRRRILAQFLSERDPFLDGRTLTDRREPALYVGKFFEFDTSPLPVPSQSLNPDILMMKPAED
jgi:hypothetical protein